MVGGVTDDEREAFVRRVKIGFVLFVGLSAGLITLLGDAGVVGFAVAGTVGLAVGAVLVWIAFPSTEQFSTENQSRGRRRGR